MASPRDNAVIQYVKKRFRVDVTYVRSLSSSGTHSACLAVGGNTHYFMRVPVKNPAANNVIYDASVSLTTANPVVSVAKSAAITTATRVGNTVSSAQQAQVRSVFSGSNYLVMQVPATYQGAAATSLILVVFNGSSVAMSRQILRTVSNNTTVVVPKAPAFTSKTLTPLALDAAYESYRTKGVNLTKETFAVKAMYELDHCIDYTFEFTSYNQSQTVKNHGVAQCRVQFKLSGGEWVVASVEEMGSTIHYTDPITPVVSNTGKRVVTATSANSVGYGSGIVASSTTANTIAVPVEVVDPIVDTKIPFYKRKWFFPLVIGVVGGGFAAYKKLKK